MSATTLLSPSQARKERVRNDVALALLSLGDLKSEKNMAEIYDQLIDFGVRGTRGQVSRAISKLHAEGSVRCSHTLVAGTDSSRPFYKVHSVIVVANSSRMQAAKKQLAAQEPR